MTVRQVLTQHELAAYADAFEAQAITISDLADLTDDELRSLVGMSRFSDRKRFKAAVAGLSSAPAPSLAGPTGMGPQTCDVCKGTGEVVQRQAFFHIRTACPRCSGPTRMAPTPTPTPTPSLSGPTRMDAPSAFPERLGNYRVLGLVGSGGMGTVVRARHTEEGWAQQQGGDVAIKLIHPHIATDPAFRSRFMAEAAMGRKVQHRGFVTTWDVLSEGAWLGTVMSLVVGEPLTNKVVPGGLPVADVVRLLTPNAEALDYLHGLGIVHRDLKPANIVVRPDGQPVVLDLGIAKDAAALENHTRTMTAMGTSAWMAPEQADAKNVDGAADRYAFGMIAYVLLAGRLPWDEGTSEVGVLVSKMTGRLAPLNELRPGLPATVAPAVMKMVSVDAGRRYPTCGAFVSALRVEAYEGGETMDAASTAFTAPTPFSGASKSGLSYRDVTALVLSVVSEKTGYPEEMLNVGMHLEADLGIDALRMGTIIVALRAREPSLPEADAATMGRQTLGQMVDMLAAGSPVAAARAAAVDAAPVTAASLPGPKLSRADLENGASGSITTIFGPAFATYDAYDRVVRMPEPPLLLADRVLGIEGEAKKLGKGRIVTETDVRTDSWYVHDDHIPAGVMIEAGQADLLLISWQGIDDLNKGERIYRLLGCDLIYRNGLPKVGDTLQYDIRCDGHARLGDIRMFFFHYACMVAGQTRLEVREGQAGFFSVKELGESGGVLWDAATAEVELSSSHLAPVVMPDKLSLTRDDLQALAEKRVADCFGESHKLACTHTLTPHIAGASNGGSKMIFHDRVVIDPTGGPWKRGYFRSEQDITPDLWFFDGHFKGDPCMPGTLMFEGCLQAMQVYMTAIGHTLTRDGWRFEPKADTVFKLRCRGQVIPTSKLLTYELFVMECGIENGRPFLKAQVMCTVDGLKCFHADPLVIEMIPDWPLSRMHEWDNWK